MKRPFNQYAIFLLAIWVSSLSVKANKAFEWEGNVSSNWTTNANWDENLQNRNPSNYIIGLPSSYNFPPIISTNFTFDVDNLDVSGVLTITSNNNVVQDDIAIRRGGSVINNSGVFGANNNLYIYDDNTHLIINGGSFNVANDLIIGEEGDPADAPSTNPGLSSVTVTGGNLNCSNVLFRNLTGDRGKVTISGGTFNVNGDVLASGESVNLEISGGGILNISGDLRMDGGNDSLIMSGGTLNIQGDFINDGVSITNGGTIIFNGSTQQSITAISDGRFYNLTIDNSSGITLNDSVIVGNQLNLTDGIIQTNGNTLTILDNATVSGGNVNSFIDGPVNKVGNDAFVFPIGDSLTYKPLGITAPSNVNDVFRAEYRYEDPASISDPTSREFGVNNISQLEYWLLNQTMGLSTVNVTLSWDTNSVVQQPSNLLVVKWDDPLLQWMNLGNGGVTGNANNGSITSSSSVNDFTAFTLGSSNFSNPLPVELETFTVEERNGNALLQWTTLAEVNNAYFEIQKSYDSKNIETLAQIGSKAEGGNSNIKLSYAIVDDDLALNKTTYYRIKQVDHDGRYKLYDFVALQALKSINRESEAHLNVYPNPTTGDKLFVELANLEEGDYQLALHNLKGELLLNRSFYVEASTRYLEFELLKRKQLPSGVYILRISSFNDRLMRKVIVD